MKLKTFLIFILLISQIGLSQNSTIKKVSKETVELISENAYKLLKLKSSDDLINTYSKVLIKNGLGKETRISSLSIKSILDDIYELRGKDDLIKIGQKLNTLNSKNINNIKGFLAEELHHNELLKLKNIDNIQSGFTSKTSDFVKKKQINFIEKNLSKKNNLYLHKVIEIDLLANKGNSKFIIEVKNIDSYFTEDKFLKYMSQIVKQKAYAEENGIRNVFWSNIGTAQLLPQQIKKIEELGVQVFQNGSTSPLVNAKINMNKIKRVLSKLD